MDGRAVRAGCSEEGEDVRFYEFIREIAAGAEIEEFEFICLGVEEEISPIGIRLHEFEFYDFAEAETEDVRSYPVFLGLGEVWGFGDADAGAVFCC